MLYKAIAFILSALLIATVQISAASAGGCGRGGGFHAYQANLAHRQALRQSRARKAAQSRAVAAAKQKKAVQQARAVKKAEPEKIASAAEPVPAKEETKTVADAKDGAESNKDGGEAKVAVAAADQTCTRFNAQIGTTVTTDCAKQ